MPKAAAIVKRPPLTALRAVYTSYTSSGCGGGGWGVRYKGEVEGRRGRE